jgi:hypothetical protein
MQTDTAGTNGIVDGSLSKHEKALRALKKRPNRSTSPHRRQASLLIAAIENNTRARGLSAPVVGRDALHRDSLPWTCGLQSGRDR